MSNPTKCKSGIRFSDLHGCKDARSRTLYKVASVVLTPVVMFFAWKVIIDLEKPDRGPLTGFLEIIPPSTFHAPGTFNTVEFLDKDAVKLHPTCEFDAAALSDLTMASKTVDSSVKERIELNLKAELQEKVNASLSAEHVQSVDLSLENTRILLLTHETLLKLRKEYLRGSCEEAVIHNIRSGARVCQAEAIIQGDMVYRFVAKDSMGNAQKKTLANHIDASVEFGGKRHGKNEFKGVGLYYGVRLSKKCLKVPNPNQKSAVVASL